MMLAENVPLVGVFSSSIEQVLFREFIYRGPWEDNYAVFQMFPYLSVKQEDIILENGCTGKPKMIFLVQEVLVCTFTLVIYFMHLNVFQECDCVIIQAIDNC